MQDAKPLPLYLPAGHVAQVAVPADVTYFPAGQFVQTEDPALEKYPASQFVHALTPAALYRPAAHVRHDVDPLLALEYVPAAHVVHPPDPALALYRPKGHDGHEP